MSGELHHYREFLTQRALGMSIDQITVQWKRSIGLDRRDLRKLGIVCTPPRTRAGFSSNGSGLTRRLRRDGAERTGRSESDSSCSSVGKSCEIKGRRSKSVPARSAVNDGI